MADEVIDFMKKTWLVVCLLIGLFLCACSQEQLDEPYNNYARFVTYDGKIIYRRFGVDSMTPLATDAKFLESPNNYGESEIMCLDPTTLETKVLFTDTGYGKLYIYNGFLYSYRYTDDWSGEVYRIRLDGTDESVITDGYLYDCDECGNMAIYRYLKSSHGKELCVYSEKDFLASVELGDGEQIVGCKITGDSLVYLVEDTQFAKEEYKIDVYALSFDKDADTICLGSVYTKKEESSFAVMNQMDCEGDTVFFSLSFYRNDNARFYYGCICEAQVGTPDSVKTLKGYHREDIVKRDLKGTPAFYYTEKRGIVEKKQLSNLLQWEKGYVYLTDDMGRYATLFTIDAVERPLGYEDEKVFDMSFEVAERVGDMVYVMYNLSVSSDENEEGWWNNYQHFYTGYLAVDMNTWLYSSNRLKEFDSVVFNDPSYAEFVISVDY